MPRVLDAALAEVAKLPPEEQDALAAMILEEIESEQRWSRSLAESLAESQDQLRALASEALAEYRAGNTQPLDRLL